MNISCVILSKNEEKNIAACIESVLWCNEIIVIDDNSSDRTAAIAQKMPNVTVIEHSLEDDFSKQRNYALSIVKGEWVLFVDADERVSIELSHEIQTKIINNIHTNGFLISRVDNIWGKNLKYGETSSVKLLRLAKRDVGTWKGKVHEVWDIKRGVETLKSPLLHYSHQTIGEFIKEINYYTTLRAQELFDKGSTVSTFHIIFYPSMKFILNFVIKRGFMDGIEGFVVAISMSFHSFLVRVKLWQLQNSKS